MVEIGGGHSRGTAGIKENGAMQLMAHQHSERWAPSQPGLYDFPVKVHIARGLNQGPAFFSPDDIVPRTNERFSVVMAGEHRASTANRFPLR